METVTTPERSIVHIEQGTLQGVYSRSLCGRTFASFQGIPYAKPPVGSLRFQEPQQPEPWSGILDASEPREGCLQYSHVSPPDANTEVPLKGNEDCLYINIYTAKLPTGEGSPMLDVLVHIHGGGFMYGSGSTYSPRYLLDHDIVMVTFNYRVGPLGFLSTEDEVIPGNMGLKDQTAALKWVQKNIAAFGGNPDQVTLSGFSAGGASVHYHYMSSLSHGLFKRGYSQSGNVLNSWAQMKEGRAKAFKLGELLGCNAKTSQELLDFLKNMSASDIVNQVPKFQGWLYNPFAPFGPTVEKESPTAFLTRQPVDALIQGEIQDVPWLTSVTTAEGLYPAADWIANDQLSCYLKNNFAETAPYIFDYNCTVIEAQQKPVADKIHCFYIENGNHEWYQGIVQAVGDRLFVAEAARAAKLQAVNNSAPVYFNVFDYRGKHSISEFSSGTTNDYGVSHADDQAYLMDCYFNTQEQEEDKDMVRFLVGIVTSYVHTGNPVPKNQDFLWEPVSSNKKELEYLYIKNSKEREMKSNADLGHQSFWESLPINEPQIKMKKVYIEEMNKL